jgi:hypothetical protein
MSEGWRWLVASRKKKERHSQFRLERMAWNTVSLLQVIARKKKEGRAETGRQDPESKKKRAKSFPVG